MRFDRAAAVVLACPGTEREALEWVASCPEPEAGHLFAVGRDPSRRLALDFVNRGARDYFVLPDDAELVQNALESAVARFRERGRLERLDRADLEVFQRIVGESPPIKQVLKQAERLLRHSSATALIMGETGTGKELLARAIHDGGPRRHAPFVALNCSALPGELIESELFGHEKGAFTDAHAAKPGLFEVADGGTLFLDEVGTLPLSVQAKLLRVLEDMEIRRVGGTRARKVDVRIIAATNDDLSRRVAEGSFREDLYYRLAVVTLELPPLRDRGDDVILIAERLLKDLCRRHGLPVPVLDEVLKRRLREHSWPGNVRELKNAIERALLLSPPGELAASELVLKPAAGQNRDRAAGSGPEAEALPFPAKLDEIVAAAARKMLQLCQGNRSEAARRLGISRPRLRRILQEGPE
ncbi:Nitrogen regulation protein NR(I) [bacterium HR33]|nr:Nitrogen regulation protein NR(I) [bacterium HR33]